LTAQREGRIFDRAEEDQIVATVQAPRRVGPILWALLVITPLILAIPAESAAIEVTCGGLAVDIMGTPGDDVIVGTPEADVIHGLGGNDRIKGLEGEDTICGGDGNDVLIGGPDADTMFGGRNSDRIRGQAGNDVLSGGRGHDTIDGGIGDDVLYGKKGNDKLAGGKGDDTISGSLGNDTLVGGSQVDQLDGGDGTDRCAGDSEVACELAAIDFVVERFLINQAVPQADSAQAANERVGTVKGRPGVIRVFISANQEGITSPAVHLFYRKNGENVRVKLSGPATVPTTPQESDLGTTFNYVFDETLLDVGIEMYVIVDRAGNTLEVSEGNNRYPESGWRDVDTQYVPQMKITVVPITIEGGPSASISQSQAEALLQKTLKVHAIGDYDINVRANYTFENPTGTSSDWTKLLSEMASLRAAENPNRQYHAFLPTGLSPGIGGIGYVGYPAAVSVQNADTIAHETGHNLNLPHNPCSGGEGNPDLNYPYEGGDIGTWGYDIYTGALYNPAVYKDLMTYCGPEWISDYSFAKVLDYRSGNFGWDAPTFGLAAAGTGTVVQFSGMVSSTPQQAATQVPLVAHDSAPAIASVGVVDHPAMAPEPGAETLVARDGDGAVVASVPFRAYAIDHADGAFFLFSVELADADLARVATWTIERAGRVVASRAAG
jgi:hypothetical protein